MFAELEFPPGGAHSWTSLAIEADAYDDWTSAPFLGGEAPSSTVAHVVAELGAHARWCAEDYAGPDHLRLTIDGEHVSFRAYLNEDDFGSFSGALANMFRVAERVGAEGEYVALANDDMAGDRVVIAGGQSRLEQVDFTGMLTGGSPPEGGLDYQAILDGLYADTQAKLSAMGSPARAAAKKPTAKKPAPAKKSGAKARRSS